MSHADRYFPYIDGMRALAVLSVILYHLDSSWLPAGFVGVDVFFVISGFVVSASVAHYRERALLPLLVGFYARRIRRIFPALIVCLLLTSLAAALFIPGSWLSSVNEKTGLYAFFGLSNFILAETGRDYFAPAAEFNPFTHTWSLAVEEQFYLVFPLLFLAWLGGGRGRWVSVALFTGGLLASAIYAGWQSHSSPLQAFFLSPSRFWELASGVLLYQFITLVPTPSGRGSGWARAALGWISLLALLASFFVTTARGFPMPGALVTVAGTLGLIFSLHQREDLRALHRLLGNRALVAVGKISYSLYLWHWPVFVMFRWTLGLDTPLLRTSAVVLASLLAVASYRLIENPVRKARLLKRTPQVAVLLGGLLLVGGAAWLDQRIVKAEGMLSLTSPGRNPAMWYPHGVNADPAYPGCDASPRHQASDGGLLSIYEPRGCERQMPLQARTLYVIGDSHALAYEAMFKQFAIRHSMRIVAYNNGGCPFVSLQAWRDIDHPVCRSHAEAALADIGSRAKSGDILFLASMRMPRLSDQWGVYPLDEIRYQVFSEEARAGRQRAQQAAVDDLMPLAERGVRIILEGPKPVFRSPPFRCADSFNRGNPVCEPGFRVSRAELESYRAPILEALYAVADRVPGAAVWDPFPLLCTDAEACSAWRGEAPLFFDGDHLSGFANRLLLPHFERFISDRPPAATSEPELTGDD
ncbi:acyltransferase family protein [Stutzerimonas urumqiensis]|uniref:acyltransferase family protein n=1 Tax=Stutzerimonas urumqiensis TaxID=638269 RepID=UPI001FE276EA|nr:acyltransferase family protein [Stutzerimonas urumqiensis]